MFTPGLSFAALFVVVTWDIPTALQLLNQMVPDERKLQGLGLRHPKLVGPDQSGDLLQAR